jgi:hypothetical protein
VNTKIPVSFDISSDKKGFKQHLYSGGAGSRQILHKENVKQNKMKYNNN